MAAQNRRAYRVETQGHSSRVVGYSRPPHAVRMYGPNEIDRAADELRRPQWVCRRMKCGVHTKQQKNLGPGNSKAEPSLFHLITPIWGPTRHRLFNDPTYRTW